LLRQAVPPIPWGHCFVPEAPRRRCSRDSMQTPTGDRGGRDGHGTNCQRPCHRGWLVGTTAQIQVQLGGHKRPALKPLIFEPGQNPCDYSHSASSSKRHTDCTKGSPDRNHTGRIRKQQTGKSMDMHVTPQLHAPSSLGLHLDNGGGARRALTRDLPVEESFKGWEQSNR
jgi:hypothetical protein